jgi:hypothetical protein
MYHKFTDTTNVDSFDYNLSTGILRLTFKNKRSYEYYNVIASDVVELMKLKGEFVKELIKKYKYKEVK